jgi:HPt (histidine-containing phosphotransfer) domain-containing protein
MESVTDLKSRRDNVRGKIMEIINDNQIKTIFEIDRTGELFRRLLVIFETDIPKLLTDLEKAIQTEDHNNAKKISHSIRSSSLNMGATELAAIAGKLEKSDMYNHNDPSVIMDFRKCFEYTVTELRGYLNLCKT